MNFGLHYAQTNLSIALKGFSISMSLISQLMKVLCYVIYRKDLRELHEVLRNLFYEDHKNAELRSTLLKPVVLFRCISYFQIISVFLAALVSLVVAPIISLIIQYARQPSNFDYVLLLPTVYPYRIIGGSALYYIHFVVESYAGLCVFSIPASVDNGMALYSSQIIGQFRTLTHQVKRLEMHRSYNEQLKRLVIKHKTVLDCCTKLEKIYGPIVIVMVVKIAAILCSVVYQISQMTSISLRQLVFLTMYASLKLLQAMIFTLPGTMISAESENFRKAAYECNWESIGDKSVGSYVMMMLLLPPVVIKACSYLEVSLHLFSSVCTMIIITFE